MDAFELRKKCFAFFQFQPQKTDKAMTIILGRVVLDLYEFDNFLHYKHGNYENEGFSMETLIEKKGYVLKKSGRKI